MAENLLTDDEERNLDPNIREELRKSRANARRVTELENELSASRKDSLFDAIGIPKDGVGELVRNTYSGDLSADAIKAYWAKYAPTSSAPDPVQAELDALRLAQQGTTGNNGSAPDPLVELNNRILNAKDKNELDTIIATADPSLIQFTTRMN